jgi:hypothetical protein
MFKKQTREIPDAESAGEALAVAERFDKLLFSRRKDQNE